MFVKALKACIFIVDWLAEVLSITDRAIALCIIHHLFVEMHIYVYIG